VLDVLLCWTTLECLGVAFDHKIAFESLSDDGQAYNLAMRNPYMHELNPEGTDCDENCLACAWVNKKTECGVIITPMAYRKPGDWFHSFITRHPQDTLLDTPAAGTVARHPRPSGHPSSVE